MKNVLLIGGCGYIGSYLYDKLIQNSYSVTAIDPLLRGNPANVPLLGGRYQDLSVEQLDSLDAVLWFGGHSSVAQSVQDPAGAISNNCIDLYQLVKKLPESVKFIYASTASLYSSKEQIVQPSSERSLIKIPEQNAYDASKFAFDYIAKNFLNNYYGLRMGTLAGYSKNLRSELVFNAMNLAACQDGVVRLKNSESYRTILYLKDLWVLIKNLLEMDHKSGFYNAGSHTCSMAQLATGIAETWGAKIQYEGDTETYSFALDCTKMQMICGNTLTSGSLEDNCRSFINEYQKAKNVL